MCFRARSLSIASEPADRKLWRRSVWREQKLSSLFSCADLIIGLISENALARGVLPVEDVEEDGLSAVVAPTSVVVRTLLDTNIWVMHNSLDWAGAK